jgi:hypothetical protein
VKLVRSGITRTVILTNRHAIKVPSLRGGSSGARIESFCRGVLANRSELQWHTYEGWRGAVAPVTRSWLGGVVQVYPRCPPLPPGARGPLPRLDPDPGDVKPDNFGMLGGRVVRVDYDMH